MNDILVVPSLFTQFFLCVLCIGSADVVGESHYGHFGISGLGHRVANIRVTFEEAIWTHEASHFTHHVQKHDWPKHLHAQCHFLPSILW